MPEGDSYVRDGDLLRCDKGVLVTPLTVLPRPSRVHGRFQATTIDCLPLVNVKPFGACAITHGPCMPPMLVWTQAHPAGRLVGGAPPLLESSVCQCALGGRISITVLPVPGTPNAGTGGAGLEAEGAALGRQEAARQQAQDDEAHAFSGKLKEASGGLAIFGLVCLAAGLVFPPAAVVGAVALELSEAALVAGVAVDVAVAIDHPTQDNWVTVGGDALAIATGYVVGKVIIGPALGALARKLAQREARLAAAATLTREVVPATTEAIEAQQAAAAQLAKREAELLRKLEARPPRTRRPPRTANAHEEAKINRIREENSIPKKQNIAYTEGTVDGKPYEQIAHSGHKNDVEGTIKHTPVQQQKLKTNPTKTDYEQAARRREEVDPTRRAHDSEVKILEDLLRKTTPASKGNIRLVSERTVCESCTKAIEQFRELRPGIRIRVSHAVIK